MPSGTMRFFRKNLIVHAVKGGQPSDVTITTSHGAAFEVDLRHHTCIGEDMTQWTVPYESVIRADDPERFVHIAANGIEQGIVERMSHFKATLAELGIEVSTGPVVQFRLRDDLRAVPEDGAVPLLYPAHFQDGAVSWPKAMRKPNAIRLSDKSRKWLWPNKGHFVVTRRFTSKEEHRRIVALRFTPRTCRASSSGFENHLNVYHVDRQGMPRSLAVGLRLYLNCSLVDRFFRQFQRTHAGQRKPICDPFAIRIGQPWSVSEGRTTAGRSHSGKSTTSSRERYATWQMAATRSTHNGKSTTRWPS